MHYKNPILPGMHPDPSICRVGEDFFLITSSFEYFPAIPIFQSRDLVSWKQIGHCLTAKNSIQLRKGVPNATGIYASTIRHHNGKFYVISTNVTYGEKEDGNFFVYTDNTDTGFSKPVFIDMPGIDPSFYFEGEHAYYTGAANGKIIFAEIDLTTGKPLHEPVYLWEGTGGNDPEGPHLYKKDGWYYLLISEGGTEYGHMVTMARSRSITGPYESCPHNPVLSNRSHSTTIKATGHADLVQDAAGNWWAVCLGIRCITYPFKHNLGRETMLVPVTWKENEWPVFGNNGLLAESYDNVPLPVPHTPLSVSNNLLAGNTAFYDDFSEKDLNPCWNFIYNPVNTLWKLTGSSLQLFGNECSLSTPDSIAWIGRRQEHHCCTVHTRLHFPCTREGEEAGLCIYMNHLHHYEAAITVSDQKRYLIFRRQIGTLSNTEHMIALPSDTITLELKADTETYTFSYSLNEKDFIPIGSGECAYLTTEVGGKFTGNYIGLYTCGNGTVCTTPADFSFFEYNGI